MAVKSDIEIAQEAKLLNIKDAAAKKVFLPIIPLRVNVWE